MTRSKALQLLSSHPAIIKQSANGNRWQHKWIGTLWILCLLNVFNKKAEDPRPSHVCVSSMKLEPGCDWPGSVLTLGAGQELHWQTFFLQLVLFKYVGGAKLKFVGILSAFSFFFFIVVATEMSEMNIPEIVCITVLVVRTFLFL